MAPRTFQIFWDINGRRAYDASGNQLANENIPYIGYKERCNIELQLIQSSDITDVFAGLDGETITCEAAIDDDNVNYYEGALTAGLTGAITEITMDGLTSPDIYNTGKLYLRNTAGDDETVDYTAYSLSDGVYTFTVSVTLSHTYAENDVCRLLAQPLIAIEDADIDKTDQATGKFIISPYAYTAPYQRAINGKWEIQNCRFGFYAFDTVSGEDVFGCMFPIKCLARLIDILVVPPEP